MDGIKRKTIFVNEVGGGDLPREEEKHCCSISCHPILLLRGKEENARVAVFLVVQLRRRVGRKADSFSRNL